MLTIIILGLLFAASAVSEVRGTIAILGWMKRLDTVRCRACGVEISEPILRVELSPGSYVCEECYEPIALEAGLEYPDWWWGDGQEELEAPEEPKQIEEAKQQPPGDVGDWLRDADAEKMEARFKCLRCDEWYKGVAAEHRCKTYVCANCGAEHPINEICMHGMVGGGGGGATVTVNFSTGKLAVSEPRMNATPWPADWPNTPVPKPPEPLKDPDVRWCEPCKMDHRKHESCPFEISRRLHPTPGVRCKYCDEPVIRLVPGQDQCNLCIMGGPPPRYWLNRTDRR